MPPATFAGTVAPAPISDADRIRRLWEDNRESTLRYCRVMLGESGFWSKQEEVCDSVDQFDTTLVPAGNSVGKSFMAARIAVAFLCRHRDSIVFTTSPSQSQLISILWKEIASTLRKARIPLGIEPTGTGPINLRFSETWYMTGHATNRIENATGHHCEHLMVLVDEGSGVPEATYAGAWSLNPSRIVVFGNPLHPHGRFHELCRTADTQAEVEKAGGERRTSNLIRIPSTMSPDIHLERSPRGMADQGFLRRNARDYNEGSIWWQSHVLAQFPDVSLETCVPPAWIKLACQAPHVRGGFARVAIDVAGGGGGDSWVILCRDDNGILDLDISNTWTAEEAARRAKAICGKWQVPDFRVSWDKGGLGHDFGNRLAAAGLPHARGYLGGASAKGHPNMRSACANAARHRLDPGFMVKSPGGVMVPQTPFSFRLDRPDWHAQLAEVGLFLRFLKGDSYALELSEAIRERLRKSPDVGDAFFQSFAFPG